MNKLLKKLPVLLITMLLVCLCSMHGMAALKGLVEDRTGIHFYYKGAPVTNTWKTVDDKTYYFNDKGNAVKGAQKIDEKYYLFTKKCLLMQPAKDRFFTQDGKTYYIYKSGEIRTDWFKKGNYIYYGNPLTKGAIAVNKKLQGINLDGSGHALKNTVSGKAKYKAFEVAAKITKPSQTKAVKIKNIWTYITKTAKLDYYMKYNPTNVGVKGFQHELALQTLTTNKGTCTGFACAFAALVDACGYEVKVVRGKDYNDGVMGKHTWIEIDGLIYDPFKGWKGLSGYYAVKVYPIKHEIDKKYDYRKYV